MTATDTRPIGNRDEAEVNYMLDRMHKSAASGRLDLYIGCFHDGALFVGTDPSEHWDIDAFTDFCRTAFAKGSNWTYEPFDRTVHVVGDVAWFIERLRHAQYGELRGSGVLTKVGSVWRIAQYVLSLPIPNNIFDHVVRQIEVG